eukprot:scaffold36010_cov101-Isochrysis_galbana.AAC.3
MVTTTSPPSRVQVQSSGATVSNRGISSTITEPSTLTPTRSPRPCRTLTRRAAPRPSGAPRTRTWPAGGRESSLGVRAVEGAILGEGAVCGPTTVLCVTPCIRTRRARGERVWVERGCLASRHRS